MTTAVATSNETPALRHRLAERPEIALFAVFVGLYLITGLRDHSLFTSGGLRSVLLLACPLAMFGAAQTLCMLTGGIDLSVAMTANMAAYVAANQSSKGAAIALLLAMGVGLVVGLINGVAIGVFQVNPLIMTLGMASVLLGLITVGLRTFLTGATNIPPIVKTFGSGTLIGPIPMNSIVLVVVGGLIIYGLKSSGLGRMIYAVGDNPMACRLAGVKVWRVLLAVYVFAALLAVIAGLLFAGRSGSVGPDQTNNYLLPGVAAAVIGGTSIFGGVGGYRGTILGAFILTLLERLLLTLDASEAFKQVFYGLIVLLLAWLYVAITGQKTST